MQTLEQETARSELLFQGSPLPTLAMKADTLRIVAVNPAAEERYGYSRNELLRMSFTDLKDPDAVSRPVAVRDIPLHPAHMELSRHRRRDGSVFPVHCASREVQIHGENMVIVSVTELSEMRPIDAEERFVEKMEALTRLGGGIAHEFNNLTTAMLATTDLALGSPHLSADIREDLQQIRAGAQRAAAVTRQLMAFSGNQSVALRQTNLNQLLELLLPLMQKLVSPSVTLQLELTATNDAEVDPARLEQVVLNLLLNAVEAMPQGGTLTISTEDIGDSVVVVVADTGHGMDEMTLSRLFEPFHSTKGPTNGRGLGLSSVYGSVRQMKGSTDVESAHGSGTRVRMFFQRALAPIEIAFVAAPARQAVTGGEVLLVVEDEPHVRSPICRSLRHAGYFVLEARDGEDALVVMQAYHAPIHLVITDVMMPNMDGGQLVALLRAWNPQMRVLFISGYSPQYLEAQGGTTVRGGEFLPKPFKLDELTDRVRSILDAEWTDRMLD